MAEKLNSSEWRDELKATLGARKDLGEEMEDEVIESFLARLQNAIDDQVAVRVAEELRHKPRRSGIFPWRVGAVLCCSIPLIAIAGVFAGTWGILAVVGFGLAVLFKA